MGKFFLASALQTWAFNDSFDFYHKVSLIALYLNERPIFHTPEGILTPYSLEQAMLKRASAKPKFFTLAEFLIPTDKKMYNQIQIYSCLLQFLISINIVSTAMRILTFD